MSADSGLFALLDGFRFFVGWESLVLRVGAYGNGRAGISIYSEAGEPIDKLTINLPDLPLAEDEIFVRYGEEAGNRNAILSALNQTGLFEIVPGFAPSGFVNAYAQRWRLARMGPLAVQDEATMAKLRQDFERRKQEIAAEVTVKALQRTV